MMALKQDPRQMPMCGLVRGRILIEQDELDGPLKGTRFFENAAQLQGRSRGHREHPHRPVARTVDGGADRVAHHHLARSYRAPERVVLHREMQEATEETLSR